MDLILSLFAFIVTVGLLVGVHEYGHLWVAQRLDIRVLSFSIGFGKALFSWRSRAGVDYALRAVPLGGYVRMLSIEDEVDPGGAGKGQSKGQTEGQSKSASEDRAQSRAPEDIGRALTTLKTLMKSTVKGSGRPSLIFNRAVQRLRPMARMPLDSMRAQGFVRLWI